MMPRFPDCASCAFHEVEQAICDMCEAADQWEPSDPSDSSLRLVTSVPRVYHAERKITIKPKRAA